MTFTDQTHIVQTYKKFDITLERGKGVYLWDSRGRRYLDFASGIGVCALGYAHKSYTAALKAQLDKLIHTSNLFYNEQIARAAANLARASGLSRVFFTNSGAEACEGAMKAARKYALNKGIKGGHFIAMKHSFHGRTLGALSLTANSKYQKPFKPLFAGVKYAKFNDLSSVKRLLSEKTCAIFLESVQGEGGINPATREFYADLRRLCDERGILLVADEIQCGMGRSGRFFAYEHFGVLPDIELSAKALGCGVSVGAFVLSERVAAHSLDFGDHGSTYGGNPLACAAVNAVFEAYEQGKVLENVAQLTPYLEKALDSIVSEFKFVRKRSGLGFMQGLTLAEPVNSSSTAGAKNAGSASGVSAKNMGGVKVGEVIKKAQENGLLVISCGKNDLRFLPPLIITRENIDEMREKLAKALREFV